MNPAKDVLQQITVYYRRSLAFSLKMSALSEYDLDSRVCFHHSHIHKVIRQRHLRISKYHETYHIVRYLHSPGNIGVETVTLPSLRFAEVDSTTLPSSADELHEAKPRSFCFSANLELISRWWDLTPDLWGR